MQFLTYKQENSAPQGRRQSEVIEMFCVWDSVCAHSCRLVTVVEAWCSITGYLFPHAPSRMWEVGCTLHVLIISYYWADVI